MALLLPATEGGKDADGPEPHDRPHLQHGVTTRESPDPVLRWQCIASMPGDERDCLAPPPELPRPSQPVQAVRTLQIETTKLNACFIDWYDSIWDRARWTPQSRSLLTFYPKSRRSQASRMPLLLVMMLLVVMDLLSCGNLLKQAKLRGR